MLVPLMWILQLKWQFASLLLAAAILSVLPSGCSLSSDSGKISFSESSVDSGLSAFEAGDWEKSEQDLAAAISRGGLQPDLAERAIRTLAIARIRQGKLVEAESDLQTLMQEAADAELCWLAMAELQLKKGDSTAAKNAIAEALKINPALQLPSDLKGIR
jgi:Tfp pilus assembly protein PilF